MTIRISNLPATLGIVIGLAGGITQNTTALVVACGFLFLAWYFARLEQPRPIKKEEQL